MRMADLEATYFKDLNEGFFLAVLILVPTPHALRLTSGRSQSMEDILRLFFFFSKMES